MSNHFEPHEIEKFAHSEFAQIWSPPREPDKSSLYASVSRPHYCIRRFGLLALCPGAEMVFPCQDLHAIQLKPSWRKSTLLTTMGSMPNRVSYGRDRAVVFLFSTQSCVQPFPQERMSVNPFIPVGSEFQLSFCLLLLSRAFGQVKSVLSP